LTTSPTSGDTRPTRTDEPAGTTFPAGTQPDLTCRFDPNATRAWLTDANGAVAEKLGIVDDFDIYGFDKWLRISDLLAAAQAAGVFGVDSATVGVLHLAGERGFVDAHRFTLSTPGYGVLCSDELDTLDLLTDHLSGVDAAMHLLAQAAHATDTLLDQRSQLARLDQPAARTTDIDKSTKPATGTLRQPGAARTFRPLAIDPHAPALHAAPPVDTAATTTRRHR
jgi:hypothetical protein